MAEPTLTTSTPGASPDSNQPSPGLTTTATILALDLGTTTGWALRAPDGLITSGTVSFRPGRYDGGGMRYLRLTNWLTELDQLSGPIEAIWFEEVRRHAGTDAAHVYGGLLGVMSAWAELRGAPYAGVPVGTLKRFIAGKGNADKQAMIAAVKQRGFNPADDNEADAIAVLLWALETKGGVAPASGSDMAATLTNPVKTRGNPSKADVPGTPLPDGSVPTENMQFLNTEKEVAS